MATFSEDMAKRNLQLKNFLMVRMYRNERVGRLEESARGTITDLFQAYVSDPGRLPEHVAVRENTDGRYRMVCDYISGMTDRFALEQHARLVASVTPR